MPKLRLKNRNPQSIGDVTVAPSTISYTVCAHQLLNASGGLNIAAVSSCASRAGSSPQRLTYSHLSNISMTTEMTQ